MASRQGVSAKALAIAAGGVVGATTRWLVLQAFPVGHGFPWPVLWINTSGSAVLGVVLAEEWRHPRARLALHDATAIGFCGGGHCGPEHAARLQARGAALVVTDMRELRAAVATLG